ncbi:hypothetical protein RBI14_15445 [Alcaligenaceae bacterium B3P038]|nr:hypothetical protein [Alcaligenaceae bacterium B3P038]
MSELPEPRAQVDEDKPTESTAESQERADERAESSEKSADESPHIGEVLADPNTNGQRRG